MAGDGSTIQIKVLGPFRVLRSTGEDCTPTSRKTCALLALLALSPGKRRTRIWVQDRLWGTRGREQGAASLRQSLVEIRKALGADRECLIADNTLLGLDASRIRVDLDADGALAAARENRSVELLEGMDIGYEDFEGWLREQRQFLYERAFDEQALAPLTLPARPASEIFPGRPGLPRKESRLILSPVMQTDHPVLPGLADGLLDSIGKTIRELGAAQVVDRRFGNPDTFDEENSGHTLHLRPQIIGTGPTACIRVTLTAPSNELVWSSLIGMSQLAGAEAGDIRILRHVNEAASVSIQQFARHAFAGNAPSQAAAICQSGIQHLFRLGRDNFNKADGLFAQAFAIDPRGVYLAWRAYLRTFLLAEQQGVCRKTLDEEAFGYLRQAFELEPNNSYVTALGAHVHALMRRAYVSAYELAERSVEINPSNPIGWACLGIAKCYLGNSDEGFQNTLLARSIAGWSPCRFQLDALSCIAGSMAGKLDEAIRLGEASHSLAPSFAAPLRYLAALYYHTGEHERSFELVGKLQAVEPGFSYARLRDTDYPAAGLRRTQILDHLPVRQI